MGSPALDIGASAELQRAFLAWGISPGDVAAFIEQEARSALEQAKGDRRAAINLGLRRMQRKHLLTDADVKRLEQVSLVVFQVEVGKQPPDKGSAVLQGLHRESLDDPAASDLGSTMIGASYAARNSTVAPAAGLIGMIVGGVLTGGSGGMLIGGLVGWTVGKVCGDEED